MNPTAHQPPRALQLSHISTVVVYLYETFPKNRKVKIKINENLSLTNLKIGTEFLYVRYGDIELSLPTPTRTREKKSNLG